MTEVNAWLDLVARAKRGEFLHKDEVIATLFSDEPIPNSPEVKGFIAAIITGDYAFPRGQRPDSRYDTAVKRYSLVWRVQLVEQTLAGHIDDWEGMEPATRQRIEDYWREQNMVGARGVRSPREAAKEMVAKEQGMSVRKLEGLMQPQS